MMQPFKKGGRGGGVLTCDHIFAQERKPRMGDIHLRPEYGVTYVLDSLPMDFGHSILV